MSNHQITFILCDECLHLLADSYSVIATLRTSHKYSFYCEHADKPKDWHPGSQDPVLVYVTRNPRLGPPHHPVTTRTGMN